VRVCATARSCADLVARCRRGGQGAWDEVLERYGRLIWSVALRTGLREDEAEEVFQRTWVAIVEGIHELRDANRLASWVASTARFQVYRWFSESGRQRRLTSLERASTEPCEPAIEAAAEENLLRLEGVAALYDALEALDGRCRKLIELLFLTEPQSDYHHVSDQLGLAVGSIGPIRARCLTRLKKAYLHLYQEGTKSDPCSGSDR
jgi:RNA polymerase sigma factor (sigma-70 family)